MSQTGLVWLALNFRNSQPYPSPKEMSQRMKLISPNIIYLNPMHSDQLRSEPSASSQWGE